MHFSHSNEIWTRFPELAAGVLYADGITPRARVEHALARHTAAARARLAGRSEGDLPQIQAWRRAYGRMGLKPTQYRCASESLLRRLRKEGALPRLHPLVDLCNALSLAHAVPVAVFDVARIAGHITVRPASGAETYLTFSGQTEHPDAGEIIYADAAGQAHARRWAHRQSGHSAVRQETRAVLIVAEGMHASAAQDMQALIATLAEEIQAAWRVTPLAAMVDRGAPGFAFPPAARTGLNSGSPAST